MEAELAFLRYIFLVQAAARSVKEQMDRKFGPSWSWYVLLALRSSICVWCLPLFCARH